MITMAWMTDKSRVIGSTWTLVNIWRIMWMPKALKSVMEDDLYKADYFAAGPMMAGFATGRAREVYFLSRSEKFVPPAPNAIQCKDAHALGEKWARSENELLVIGGKQAFELLLPYATTLHIAETHKTYPGNVKFDTWEKAPGFELTSSKDWVGGNTLTYTRATDFLKTTKG